MAAYAGDLLAGLTFDGAPEYEGWLTARRQQCHLAFLGALSQLAEAALALGDPAGAYVYAERQLALEPWREIAHRQTMRALAASDQRSGAMAAYQRCRTVLAEELGVDPEPETEALYLSLLEPEPVPPPQPRPALSNLPTLLTSFVGRQEELAQLAALLPHKRLLTLTGPGGTGKTRLALETGSRLRTSFSDGVWLVELADLSDPQRVDHAIAHALGVTEREDRPLRPLLADFLAERRLLLLLDNCEHLLAACAQAADFLLMRCPGLTVLATSREPLNLPGEQIWPVSPLAQMGAQVSPEHMAVLHTQVKAWTLPGALSLALGLADEPSAPLPPSPDPSPGDGARRKAPIFLPSAQG